MPAKWIRKCGIKASDEIELEEQGKALIISCDKNVDGGELSIDVSGLGPMVRRVIASAYKAGYDILRIKFSSPEELASINKVMGKTCMGFEILRQEKDYIVAKKILNVMSNEFDHVLRRIFLSINSMATDTLEGFSKNDKDMLQTVILRDDNINKFSDFCRRLLNRRGYCDFKKTPLIYHIVEELEKVGDLYKYISEDTINGKIKSNKELLNLFQITNDYVHLFYDLYYKFELKKVRKLGDDFRKIKSVVDKLVEHPSKDMIVIYRLYYVACLIYDLNGALIAIHLD